MNIAQAKEEIKHTILAYLMKKQYSLKICMPRNAEKQERKKRRLKTPKIQAVLMLSSQIQITTP